MFLTTTSLAAALTLAASGSGTAPANFGPRVDNPWFPLVPGAVYRYRGMKDGKPALDVVEVTRRTRTILGVRNRALRDRLFLAGKLAERTTDWYAQDPAGNVWYFGEATATLDRRGRVTSREGSFRAGEDGALAGIFMPAHPRVGEHFQQEYSRGQAEDRFRVVAVGRRRLRTRETTPLEPGVVDGKEYLRGVGTVSERQLAGPGPREALTLVSYRRAASGAR